jgi:hypothetical protein
MNSTGKIVQLVNPTNNQDAATKSYVDTKFTTVPRPTNTNDVANKGYVDTSIPIGGIIMWSGSSSALPTNWKFCNGSNGTPDLRGRFVMCMNRELDGGYSSSGPLNYWANINTTGGSPNAVVVTHNHGITDPGHGHNIGSDDTGYYYNSAYTTDRNRRLLYTSSEFTGITINNHGEDGTNKNIPQHYVLAYIMRIS